MRVAAIQTCFRNCEGVLLSRSKGMLLGSGFPELK
jgi:hypothetical protein